MLGIFTRPQLGCAALVVLFWPTGESYASPAPHPCTAEYGTVFVIGGLGGGSSLSSHTRAAFDRCQIAYDICTFHWGHAKGRFLADLVDHANVQRHAAALAQLIRQARCEKPNQRIVVFAWSAGVGVALGAAELLPADTIDRIVLMCAACSPSYDLRGALRASHGGIVSFRCCLDQCYLNVITHVCGTIDRRFAAGAGALGFRVPRDLSPDDQCLYLRLVEINWRPEMILDGHSGGHLFYKNTRFLCNHVVPWLR